MSTFADEIEARCIREALQTQGAEAHADLTLDVASALTLSIALQAKGHPVAAEVILQTLIGCLPEMLERRCRAVRESLVEGPLQ